MVLICGIEEAGRGPVIGPLVVCGVLINEKDEAKLKQIGVKDSKLLTPKQREIMFEQIKKVVKDSKLLIAPTQEVDAALGTDYMNLNKLEAQKMAEVINELKPDKVILDCPSNNIKQFVDYLKLHLKNKDVEIIAEHKADVKYLIVGAASILAKVTRDAEIKKIKEKIGIDFGSGYTSDPRTVEFLKKYWDKYPSIFRKEWISYKKVVKEKGQKSLGEF
ncbi:ribonuclease HII [Candidatus Woesearchaeota archaeon]|nr:ribonuclease HII [Candidatus Woesearchaeota archaeon]